MFFKYLHHVIATSNFNLHFVALYTIDPVPFSLKCPVYVQNYSFKQLQHISKELQCCFAIQKLSKVYICALPAPFGTYNQSPIFCDRTSTEWKIVSDPLHNPCSLRKKYNYTFFKRCCVTFSTILLSCYLLAITSFYAMLFHYCFHNTFFLSLQW